MLEVVAQLQHLQPGDDGQLPIVGDESGAVGSESGYDLQCIRGADAAMRRAQDRCGSELGPIDRTHVFATWAFRVGIECGDIPLGASVSLFMVPILTVAAIIILRDVNKRGERMQ